jgi:hypothetical protein
MDDDNKRHGEKGKWSLRGDESRKDKRDIERDRGKEVEGVVVVGVSFALTGNFLSIQSPVTATLS